MSSSYSFFTPFPLRTNVKIDHLCSPALRNYFCLNTSCSCNTTFRESEPNSWEDTMKDELDRNKYPRMPWHDVHCALWGPPCRDVARHFVQRWNYAKVHICCKHIFLSWLWLYYHIDFSCNSSEEQSSTWASNSAAYASAPHGHSSLHGNERQDGKWK